MASIRLPTAVGHLAEYWLRGPKDFPARAIGPFNRVALAAAHVVADPLADVEPGLDVAIDWERTVAYREYLWDLGSAWPRPWTPPSAAWGLTGTPRRS